MSSVPNGRTVCASFGGMAVGSAYSFFDPHFFGIERSTDLVLIQLALINSRTPEQKAAFYKAVAEGLHERLGMRKEDVFINLLPVDKADWSFGNGEASLVTP